MVVQGVMVVLTINIAPSDDGYRNIYGLLQYNVSSYIDELETKRCSKKRKREIIMAVVELGKGMGEIEHYFKIKGETVEKDEVV